MMRLADLPDPCPVCGGRTVIKGTIYQCIKCGLKIAEFVNNEWREVFND